MVQRHGPLEHGPWALVASVYTPGTKTGASGIAHPSTEVAERAQYGFTSVTQRCVGCDWHNVTRHLGRVATGLPTQTEPPKPPVGTGPQDAR